MKAHYDELVSMFRRLLAQGSFQLPRARREFVEELLQHNEFGVAFDEMIDTIRENRIPLTEADIKTIAEIGQKMRTWIPSDGRHLGLNDPQQ